MASPSSNVTLLLQAWNSGDATAGNELIVEVYKELRRLASHYLKAERPDHTLQPTALVHELYLKLLGGTPVEWKNRGHFFAVAARQLRRIIVDYARSQHAAKRGGLIPKVMLEEVPAGEISIDARLIDLDTAMDRLATLDPRAAQVVELKYFGGLTDHETAEALDVSPATVKRDWEFARTWLTKEIAG